jgi:O-antigen/teichoic acid export membrane protein
MSLANPPDGGDRGSARSVSGAAVRIARLLPRGSVVSGAAIAVSLVLGVISGILSARLLGPSGKGVLALAFVWGALVSQVAEMGVNQALTYHASVRPEQTADLWGKALAVALAQSVVAVPIALLASRLLVHSPGTQLTVAVALLAMPLGLALGYELSLLRGAERFGAYNATRLGQAVGWTAVVVGFSLLSVRSALGLMLSYLGIQAVAAIVASRVLLRICGRPRFRRNGLKALLRYGVVVWVAGIGYQTNFRLDQFILGALVAAAAVGQYATAVGLASGLTIVSMGIAVVTLPAVARADPAHRLALGRRNWLVGVTLMVGGAILLWLLAPHIVSLLLGVRFRPVVPLFQVLVLAQVALGSTQILHEIARGQGRLGFPALVETAGALVTVVALLLVVPRWGAIGAAWVSVGVYWPVTAVLLVGIFLRRGREDADVVGAAAQAPASVESVAPPP